MSTKPAKTPRCGATSPGVITGTIVEPSEDKKSAGFVAVERPPAELLTWYLELIYEWCQYLSDGALTGNTSIAGTLTQTGGGATTLSGTLGVTGLVTATAGVTAGANTDIKVQGANGRFVYDSLTQNLPLPVPVNGSTIQTNLTIVAGSTLRVPIVLNQNAVINSAKFKCQLSASSSVTFSFVRYTGVESTTVFQTSTTTGMQILTGALGSGIGTATGGIQVSTGETYYLTLACTAGSVIAIAAEANYAQG